jgi:hypothetical protein
MLNNQHKRFMINEKSLNKIAAAKYFMETIIVYVRISITIYGIIHGQQKQQLTTIFTPTDKVNECIDGGQLSSTKECMLIDAANDIINSGRTQAH